MGRLPTACEGVDGPAMQLRPVRTSGFCYTHGMSDTIGSPGGVKPRKSEYVEQTRIALLDAAQALFVENGYEGTSLAEVAKAARFTKGAVYGHFHDKKALFIAVFERIQNQAIGPVLTVDAFQVAEMGVRDIVSEFLNVCSDPLYRRVVLELGPTVLGPTLWRELDHQYAGKILESLFTALLQAGIVEGQSPYLLSRLCCAAAGEAALQIAASRKPDQTREHAICTLSRMFNGLISSATTKA